MKMVYETIIGMEVHVELNTKTKMFCYCSADYFGSAPNSLTCPVCLGLPGALPKVNEEAIKKCIQIGLALNCSINKTSYFERKNYFYPDLAKGFQTSQLVLPVCVNGWLEIEDEKGNLLKIRINRAHQEEDTGKLTHIGSETLIDFNRSSVPLVEIVTEPDFRSSLQVRDYAKKLQQIFKYLSVSGADMEKGQMRLEANVSVRPVGQEELPPYRVELKNINSFRFIVAAIEFEVKRQTEALENGEKLFQETRGWNEAKNETYLQRSKEDAHDYRYFPEPDLPEMHFSGEQIEEIRQQLPELPVAKLKRYTQELNLKLADAKVLADDLSLAVFFEEALSYAKEKGLEPQQIANYIINQKIELVGNDPAQVVDDLLAKKSSQLEDNEELEKIAKEAIKENPEMVESYKLGKFSVVMALVGVVMRKSGGRANAQKLKEILEKLLTA